MFEVLRYLQRLRLSVLCINIRTPMPKMKTCRNNLMKSERWENIRMSCNGRGNCWPPLEQRRHGMIGEGIRQQREESLGNSQGLGKGMLWHGNPSLLVMLACVGLWVAVRPWSLATSYLALVAARIQGINLSLTPLPETNQIPWERWGVTQRMPLSSCPPSFPITLVHQPSTFSSCVSTKSNTLLFCHWCPQLANL